MTEPGHLSSSQIRPNYDATFVLLFYWQHDDLDVLDEVERLSKVFNLLYGFHVERCAIPSLDSDTYVQKILEAFVKKWESSETLLITYYAGHGGLSRNLLNWSCTRELGSPEVAWYRHQANLEKSTSDVLLLLDCCSAAGVGGCVREGTSKEVITAVGFDGEAPGPGGDSFTQALIEELIDSQMQRFTALGLHDRVKYRLQGKPPGISSQRVQPHFGLMGVGGEQQSRIWLTSYAWFPLCHIAVMGYTGAGKTSIINELLGEEALKVGHRQHSETQEVLCRVAIIQKKAVTLLDTPGFGDTKRSDTQVLRMISTYLMGRYRMSCMLTGILYLRDINDSRMTGPAVRNFDMFLELCGKEYLQNVVLVTTKWDDFEKTHPDMEYRLSREKELKEEFWSGMIKHGCGYEQHSGVRRNAASIICHMRNAFVPNWIQLQYELSKGLDLEHTTVGKHLSHDLKEQIEAYEERIASLESQMAQYRTGEFDEIIETMKEEKERQEKVVKQMLADQKQLRQKHDDLIAAEQKRLAKKMLPRFKKWMSEIQQKDIKKMEIAAALGVGAAIIATFVGIVRDDDGENG